MTSPAEQPRDDQSSSLSETLSRDIVVIGASAGGLEALNQLVPNLPEDLPAAIFIVLHLPPASKSSLPFILRRKTLLQTGHAHDGDAIHHGRIYIAPPDHHLLLEEGHVRLSRGPRENGNRPAIDPLFRTAARIYGPRVVGIVLSGNLGDGTVGLRVVSDHGGETVVQDPQEALFPSMPSHAIEFGGPDHVLPAAEIAQLVTDLAARPAALRLAPVQIGPDRQEKLAGLSCPDCGGPLSEFREGRSTGYVCRVGHSFSAEGLYAEHADALESALWTAVRVLHERSDLATRLAERLDRKGSGHAARRFRENAEDARRHAELLRGLVEEFDSAADLGPAEAEVASAAKGPANR